MKKKINFQLIGISILAIFVTLMLTLTIFYDLYKKQVQDDLRTTCRVLKSANIFREDNRAGYHFDIKELRVTWIDKDGTVLYDNDVDANTMENHAKRPEVISAFQKGYGEEIRKSATMNKSTFYYAMRLSDGTVLRVAKEEGNLWSLVSSVVPIIVLVMIFMILLCILLAQILTRSIIRPIEEMTLNIDDYSIAPAYKELVPFVHMIRAQHADILKGAKMRQDFTANVSHELKTPLTAISGYAELMENNMVAPDEISPFAAKIRQNAERLLSLINDIIRLSELDNVEEKTLFEAFDLSDLARQCVENLKMYAHKHDVTIVCIGVPTIINANKDMISELLENLCNNAIRYNNKNGNVIVEVGTKDGHAFLQVRDTGIGIPKEHQERVFERFYRVDKSRSKQTGGTGLGLAIVKHIVAIHDAELTLDSEVGKGTTITVLF